MPVTGIHDAVVGQIRATPEQVAAYAVLVEQGKPGTHLPVFLLFFLFIGCQFHVIHTFHVVRVQHPFVYEQGVDVHERPVLRLFRDEQVVFRQYVADCTAVIGVDAQQQAEPPLDGRRAAFRFPVDVRNVPCTAPVPGEFRCMAQESHAAAQCPFLRLTVTVPFGQPGRIAFHAIETVKEV